jgi:hypothetical protein
MSKVTGNRLSVGASEQYTFILKYIFFEVIPLRLKQLLKIVLFI